MVATPLRGGSKLSFLLTYAETNTYQSIGLCTQKCTSDYAFGILQDKSCWCSNVAPNQSTNSNVTKCNDPCPGYPNDSCGSLSDGLFGYIVLNRLASSTASAESTSTGTAVRSSPTSPWFQILTFNRRARRRQRPLERAQLQRQITQ